MDETPLIDTFQILNVWTNLLYLTSCIILVAKKRYYLATIFVIMTVISFIFHTNLDILFSHKTWDVLDQTAAFSTIMITFIAYIMLKKERSRSEFLFLSITIVVSITSYIFNIIQLKRIKQPIVSTKVIGPIFFMPRIEINRNMMYQVYHLSWHICSAFTLLIFSYLL
jgi:hypothetical protein